MSAIKPIAIKKVIVNGQEVECKVLPYIPPSPVQEMELGWRKKPSSAATALGYNPWPGVDKELDG